MYMPAMNFYSMNRCRFAGVRNYLHILVVFIGVCLFYTKGEAQGKHRLHLFFQGKDTINLKEFGISSFEFTNQQSCLEYVQQPLLSAFRTKGYLAASLDSLVSDSIATQAWIYLGASYAWGEVLIDSATTYWLNDRGLKKNSVRGEVLSSEAVEAYHSMLMDLLEENGYPFARLKFDSSYFSDNRFYARLKLDRGPLYRIDSLVVDGELRIRRRFLEQYLGVGGGAIYRKSQLESVSGRLADLGFLRERKPWDLTLLGTGSSLNLYLESQRTSRFNLLAGLMPSNNQIGGKLLLTGEADLALRNAFGEGEELLLTWQQIQVKSPRLQVGFQKPYVFGTGVGIDFQFDLLKKDSSFLTLNARLGIRYELSKKQTGKLFVQQFTSNLIEVDTALIKRTKQLPSFLDFRTTNMGVEIFHQATDYRLNPRKGWEWGLRAVAGLRRTIRNNSILALTKDASGNSFDFKSLYGNVETNAYQVKVNGKVNRFSPIGRQATLKSGIQTGWVQSKQLFFNELFQLGGIKTLRGFDEESIFASRYAIGTLEYRYLIGVQSNLYAFLDHGLLARRNMLQSFNGSYTGMGLGLSFETKSGIFNLAYAAGKRGGEAFNFRESKIHFGFASLF
jgi:outer membrane protein assembly factor BamA